MSLRIAIISTPRTGSTWLRLLLREAYALPGFAVHRPDDLNWDDLPEECIVNLHWRRTPELVHRLREKGFRVVCCVRHPLDILISILQYSCHDDSTLQWMDGEGGTELPIQGAMPGSALFLEYGAGSRAAALMSVSREWAAAPECLPVRYEDLVADGAGELKRIADALGEPTRRPIAEVVEDATMPKLRVRYQAAYHFWQGRPGLWRSLLIRPAVERLAEVHHAYCVELGYSCAADPLLTATQADANWLALTWPQVSEKLRGYRSLQQELGEIQAQFRCLEGEIAAKTRGNEDLIARNAELTKGNETLTWHYEELTKGNKALLGHNEELAKGHAALARDNEELLKSNTNVVKGCQELHDRCMFVQHSYKETLKLLQTTCEERQAEQARLHGLGPTALAMARWLSGVSHHIPGAAYAAKRLARQNLPETVPLK